MIDNYRKAMVLVAKMNAALPIPARPSRSLVDLFSQRGVTMDADGWLVSRPIGALMPRSCGVQWPPDPLAVERWRGRIDLAEVEVGRAAAAAPSRPVRWPPLQLCA